MPVHYRNTDVEGLNVFYREAGDPSEPTVVLLHGAPTSSFMFRNLIPMLEGRFHVIAPDLIGYGHSAAPSVEEFQYDFDSLTRYVDGLLEQLGVQRYAIYVQDYGAPVGWRLALNHPERISAIITQNGNGYEDGFDDAFWGPVWDFNANPTPEKAAAIGEVLGLEAMKWQYTHGVPDPSVVSPDGWTQDFALISRPGVLDAHVALLGKYTTNRDLYPRLHEYFRDSQVPLLAVWGKNDLIFIHPGATAFARDLPNAEIHLLDGGHFLLESHLQEAGGLILDFLSRALSTRVFQA
ncbi:alpha/beta fold hydrolase [Arthrobacter zhaoguopingii]|uniref:alpha/beta fold hydrolase n=1 Tax=Arthrobacter zhaoguopingii TaxID=2681491 RepID=UPI00135B70BF|nr:alpha/beta fold hydrolase [Arthrobacter zhaoguopingii]